MLKDFTQLSSEEKSTSLDIKRNYQNDHCSHFFIHSAAAAR